MVSIVGIFLISAIIGAAVALGLLALANRRLGIAVLLGGLAMVVGLPVLAITMALVVKSRAISVSTFPEISVNSPQFSTEFHTDPVSPRWSIALMPVLFMAVAFIALLFLLARRGLGHAATGSHGKIWPAFLVVPILAFLLLGKIRVERMQSSETSAPSLSQSIPAVQIQSAIQRQQESLKKSQAELAKQQAALAKQAAALAESLHKQIDQMDIHELMDKFDAPRIALKMPITPSPAALVIAAANAATGESNKKEAAKDDANSKNDAIAESEKSRPGSNAEHQQPAEQPADKPAEATAVVEAEAPAAPAPPTPPVPVAESPIAAAPAPPAPAPVVPAKTVAVAQSIAATTNAKAPSPPPTAEKETQTASATPPSWINEPPKRMGDVRREVIATDPYESDEECYQAADIYLMLRTYERLQQLQGHPLVTAKLPSISFGNDAIKADGDVVAGGRSPLVWADRRFVQLSSMGIGPDYLRKEIVAKNPGSNEPREYLETVQQSFGPMKKLYMQIEFTPAVDRELMQRWDGLARQERFAQVGVGAGFVLALLFSVWGLLRIDTATKGYYSKWLFLGVPAVIIAGIAFCAADPFHMF